MRAKGGGMAGHTDSFGGIGLHLIVLAGAVGGQSGGRAAFAGDRRPGRHSKMFSTGGAQSQRITRKPNFS